MNKQRNHVAWREGRYIYCISHSTNQVTDYEYLTPDSPYLWEGRKCDWCRKKLRK